MKLKTQTPKFALNKAFLKQRPLRSEIELFKNNLQRLLSSIDEIEREENQKTHVRDFLRDTYYKESNEINTKGTKDLVIHLGKTNKDKVGVIIEAKRPSNKGEMMTAEKPNVKALHELVLYYLRERIDENNIDVKYLVATNIYEWFIVEASYFDKLFSKNTSFVKQYKEWRDGKKVNKTTDLFYKEIAKPFIESLDEEIPCAYFDLRDYQTFLDNENLEDDKNLIELYKILSPFHLLKEPFAEDSNALNKPFYDELLHIIGLEEVRIKSKSIIRRKEQGNRDQGSLLENAITILKTKDSLRKVKNIADYGAESEERYFNVALELCLIWINRILFLKLLESQLVIYHKGKRKYRFLNIETVSDFDELFTLFHQVLAKKLNERDESITEKYARVPYLNSSLFEPSELEDQTITIESLKDSATLSFNKTTILKKYKAENKTFTTLEYLFKFLDAYDFASEGAEDVQADSRSLINASVLGKVFEKINGYKDGSIFTPGFITMYMCRQSIRLAVVQKFKDKYEIDIETFDDLKNFIGNVYKTEKIKEYNALVNSLHLCDPAVGSGHFLVSSLNEIIAVKGELGILADEELIRLSDYSIAIENDELIITDEKGEIFEYQINEDGRPTAKTQRLQKTLFHEKQTIIENCLFGVDINPNSVKICRLRLWIELLKNAYYKESSGYAELETLPNIDINIKEGNSLLSHFKLDDNLKEVLKTLKYDIEDYRNFVFGYKETRDREAKREFEAKIKQIKKDFTTQLFYFSPERKKRREIKGDLGKILNQPRFFEESEDIKLKEQQKINELQARLGKQDDLIKQIEENALYKNAFEWRFEFPEILDNEGNFLGFDIVIGNPPYVYRNADVEPFKNYFKLNYFNNFGNFDLYKYFIEKAIQITKEKYFQTFITNSSFLVQDTFHKTREFFLDNVSIKTLVPLGANVFDEATVDSAIYLIKKTVTDMSLIEAVTPAKTEKISETKPYFIQQSRFRENHLFVFDYLLNDNEYKFVSRLFKDFPQFEQGFEFGVGINTGYIKDELTASEKVNETYHPMVSGTGISHYGNVKTDGFILYDKEFVKSKGKLGRTLPEERFFSEPKILVVRTRNLTLKQRIISTIDDEGKYNLNRLSNIISKEGYSLKGLLGIINSKLFNWLYSTRFLDYEIKPTYLKISPLADVNNNNLIELVDKMLKKKKLGEETEDLENEIDCLVYRLYDLTDEEIKIVEGEKS